MHLRLGPRVNLFTGSAGVIARNSDKRLLSATNSAVAGKNIFRASRSLAGEGARAPSEERRFKN